MSFQMSFQGIIFCIHVLPHFLHSNTKEQECKICGKHFPTKNKLKNQITEPSVTIRKMRSNQVEVPNYTSFIFLTNHVDAIRIEPGDRRYNIAPRQERKLIEAYPQLVTTMDKLIPRELLHFAGALATFKYDETLVRMPIDNEAKIMMKTADK